ncbi:Exonuclease [hydrothermal vent metagenome]|uniref:Exonuclease n=1 Tax=hydrothermal vent metagenome TaxID=652676 RepID=A0A1W1BM52_9ZZZZ
MSKTIIFDTETTGIQSDDRIIQIGAISIDSKDRDYRKVFDELCSTTKPISIDAMATHGIRDIELEGKPPFVETEFYKYLLQNNQKENYLIAHNIEFDLGMLEREGFKNSMQLIDTLQCIKHLYEIDDEINGYRVPNHKLQTFRYMLFTKDDEESEAHKYGVEIKAHDAIGDVVILKLLLREIYREIMSRYNLKEYEAIMQKMVELTKQPVEVKVINFGKHSGKTISQIEQIDSGWIDWLYREQKKQKDNSDPKFQKDLFYTLEKIVDSRNR